MSVAIAAAGIGSKNVRLADELERAFRVLAYIREVMEQSLAQDHRTTDGRLVIDSGTMRQWGEFTRALDTLVSTKIRYDKNAHTAAEFMTPAEEMEAVRSYVRCMEPRTRKKFLEEEAAWHETNR